MREIKFRAKPISKHKNSPNWVYGLVQSIAQDGTGFLRENNKNCVHIDSKTIGQYTGLKDSNGKEIYEGDIFDVVDEIDNGLYCEDVHEKCIVFYSNEWAGFCYGNAKHEVYDRLSELEGLEIIGNIYENKELIEDGEKHETNQI